MLKISDILKKAKKSEPRKKTDDPVIKPVDSVVYINPAPVQEKKPDIKIEESSQQVYQETVKKNYIEDAQVLNVYERAISFVQGVMDPLDNGQKGSFILAEEIVNEFIRVLENDENQLLRLFFAEYFIEKGYIYQHSVNVCILCLKLAMVLNYDHAHLRQIGLAALVHDIGLINYDSLISRPARFNVNDFLEVKKHPILGKDILKKIALDLNFEIFDVVHQEHERIDGSGYPYGLKEKEICEYAKLIGVVDVYEAMNHARPYRKKIGHLKIIKDLISEKSKFEPKFLKTLIDNVGIFPLNTIIRLNTKEIAIVISQNPKMPLKPVISVTHDTHGQKLPQSKLIDLSKNFSIYIHDIYNDVNLN